MTIKTKEIAERIFLVFEQFFGEKVSGNQIAKRLGLTPQIVNGWRRGVSAPQYDHLSAVIELTGADPGWLLTGQSSTQFVTRVNAPKRNPKGRKSTVGDATTPFARRLRECFNGIHADYLSEIMEVSVETARQYFIGPREPKATELSRLHKKLKVDINWLLSKDAEPETVQHT